MRVAAVQMQSGTDPFENLLFVNDCVLEAAARGAKLVCFPENVFYRGPRSSNTFDRNDYVLAIKDGSIATQGLEFAQIFKEFAMTWPIAVSLGSVFELDLPTNKLYNSHWLVRPGGQVQAYRKVHLFDYTSGPIKYHESEDFSAGEKPVAADFADGFKLGLSICFDLRFPELYRDLVLKQQANLLLIPAAFTYETGRAHWDTLLRARAVENLSFLIATGQWGSHKNFKGQELFCYGRTQILNPWGEVLAEAGTDGDALLVADLNMESLHKFRASLPALDCVRLYK